MGLPLTVVGRLDAEELLQALYGPLKRTAAFVLAFVIVLIITGIAVRQRRFAEKRSERELRAREKRMTAVVENSPSAIYLKDMDGRVLMVNKEYEPLNAVSREQFVGKPSPKFSRAARRSPCSPRIGGSSNPKR